MKNLGRQPSLLQKDQLITMNIIPRKLTRKEARTITDEVMSSGVKDTDLRFMLAVVKSIHVTNNSIKIKGL